MHLFFFNDTATTEIYTLSLHDALPICRHRRPVEPGRVPEVLGARHRPAGDDQRGSPRRRRDVRAERLAAGVAPQRSEEHTSELQSRQYLVCRLLLEKKKTTQVYVHSGG